MPKLNKKEQLLVIGLSVLALLFLVERFILTPFTDKMESSEIRIEAQEEKMARLFYMESQKDHIAEVFKKAEAYIISDSDEKSTFSNMMNTIEEFAQAANVIILKMKPETEDEEGQADFKVRRVTLSVEGYLSEVVEFLYKLENSNYPLNIHRLDLKSKSRATNLMTADMEVHLIYFK
ncbi:MAG: GspMb/PilO family protein [Candidatus Omnitrophota bacterium]